jgi:hypothetical protein
MAFVYFASHKRPAILLFCFTAANFPIFIIFIFTWDYFIFLFLPMICRYTRRVSIVGNEFVWQGCSPMASWGYTNENDGTDGLQPRFTTITDNYVHEFGHYQKQSSMWFQGKACQTILERNINFNGPRAGINFNDGCVRCFDFDFDFLGLFKLHFIPLCDVSILA